MLPDARLTRSDAALAVLAVVGLLAFAWLFPREHPDTAASFALTASGAEARADAVLQAAGFDADGLDRRAVLDGSDALMDSLQRALGHAEATARLRAEPGRLPAFRWRVAYESRRGDRRPAFAGGPFSLDLGADGRLWRLVNAEGAVPEGDPDRAAVARALQAEDRPDVPDAA